MPTLWTRDAAALVADWRHHAILELVHEPEFRPDVRWIARVLGCAHDDVAIALQRLLRTGLLRMTAVDRWEDTCTGRPSSFADFAYEAVRRVLDPQRTGG